MLTKILNKLENPKRPLLGPNVKALKFWGLLLPNNFWWKIFYLFMHFAVTVFTATEYVDVWFVKYDLNLLLNNLKITMLATVSVCKVSTFLYWQKRWIGVIDYVTRADLYQRLTRDEKKIDMINRNTSYCRKITYLYWSLMYTTVIIVMTQPVMMFFSSEEYRENVKNGTGTYLQVVSSWVPFNKNLIPGYLAASAYQSYAAIYGGGWITSFDTNAMVIMVFFRAELELLRMDSANIFGSEKEPVDNGIAIARLKDCHRRHVELVKFARIFDANLSPIMLLYMFVCSVMLCVTAYQITIETSPMQRFLTTEYLVFGVAQLFMYCWHSNDVLYAHCHKLPQLKIEVRELDVNKIDVNRLDEVAITSKAGIDVTRLCNPEISSITLLQSQDLMHGPFESSWFVQELKFRKDLFILIAQFRKKIVFSAGPFAKLTVDTFINILKGAYSYYTLLSQMK